MNTTDKVKTRVAYTIILSNGYGPLDAINGSAHPELLEREVSAEVATLAKNTSFRHGDTITVTFPEGHPDED